MKGKRILQTVIAFALGTFGVCIANFVIQFLLIFVDIISRQDASSAMVIVLWLVTGVFGAVFSVSFTEQMLGKEGFTHKESGTVIGVVSVICIGLAFLFFSQGFFKRNASDFSLLFSNAWVFISYFTGAGAMSLILRKMDK